MALNLVATTTKWRRSSSSYFVVAAPMHHSPMMSLFPVRMTRHNGPFGVEAADAEPMAPMPPGRAVRGMVKMSHCQIPHMVLM